MTYICVMLILGWLKFCSFHFVCLLFLISSGMLSLWTKQQSLKAQKQEFPMLTLWRSISWFVFLKHFSLHDYVICCLCCQCFQHTWLIWGYKSINSFEVHNFRAVNYYFLIAWNKLTDEMLETCTFLEMTSTSSDNNYSLINYPRNVKITFCILSSQ